MDYVTLTEAAELEGIKYKTMAQRLARKQSSFQCKNLKSENGGKDIVLVAVSSLSKQARAAWKEREKLKVYVTDAGTDETEGTAPEKALVCRHGSGMVHIQL